METFVPHEYQKYAIEHIYNNPKSALLLDMGLGKTVITLTALDELMFNRFEVGKVLIIAPLRVAEDTWGREIEKWAHLKNLKISKILGSRTQRVKALFHTTADIYIINRENVVWLVNELEDVGGGSAWDFDTVIIDELSSFKSPKAQRFKHLRKVMAKCNRVVGLTGTPAPNGLIDLWSQIYLLDQGERLGKTVTGFRERYFLPEKVIQHVVVKHKIKEGAETSIRKAISDICMSMKAEDWLDMPEKLEIKQNIKLGEKEYKDYRDFERNAYMEFLEGDVTAATKAALTNKLLQYSNGAMYYEGKNYVETHNKKLEALEEIVELSNGKPILLFYSYKHDLERIKKRFKDAVKLESSKDIERWNKGEIQLMLAHPASAGHGLNLQSGGSIIVWFGLTWSLELYQQANARLYRQGQKETVIIHHLLSEGTADESVMESLLGKTEVQEGLLNALKARIGG